MSNLIFVDDDSDILEINSRYFMKLGYNVMTLSNPMDLTDKLNQFLPDCIILDVMMPGTNGYELCKKIRLLSPTPIIFLSGLTKEKDKIKGLMNGGDDYMIKPYSLSELAARIHAQIRRNQALNPSLVAYPPILLDLFNHKVYCNSNEVFLSNKEYELLVILLKNANHLVTYKEIAHHIWNSYTANDNNTIMVLTSRLRKKLDCSETFQFVIETVRSKGYIYHTKDALL